MAIGVDLVLVFLISILGLPGVAPIEPIAAFTVALAVLSAHWNVLDELAQLLSQEEVVQGETLRKMMSKSPAETLPDPQVS